MPFAALILFLAALSRQHSPDMHKNLREMPQSAVS
jgi:hypothetical protein